MIKIINPLGNANPFVIKRGTIHNTTTREQQIFNLVKQKRSWSHRKPCLLSQWRSKKEPLLKKQRCWEKIKSAIKKILDAEKIQRSGTGGGPCLLTNPICAEILEISPHVSVEIDKYNSVNVRMGTFEDAVASDSIAADDPFIIAAVDDFADPDPFTIAASATTLATTPTTTTTIAAAGGPSTSFATVLTPMAPRGHTKEDLAKRFTLDWTMEKTPNRCQSSSEN